MQQKCLRYSNTVYFSWKCSKNLLRQLTFNTQFLYTYTPAHPILLNCEKFGISIYWFVFFFPVGSGFMSIHLWNSGTYAYSINTCGWCQKWDNRAFWRNPRIIWYPNSTLKIQRPRFTCGSWGRNKFLWCSSCLCLTTTSCVLTYIWLVCSWWFNHSGWWLYSTLPNSALMWLEHLRTSSA